MPPVSIAVYNVPGRGNEMRVRLRRNCLKHTRCSVFPYSMAQLANPNL